MIYFIQSDRPRGPIKIGHTNKFEADSRISALQTGSAFTLSLLCIIQGTIEDEKRLHKKFEHLKIKGEWFRPDKELIDFVIISRKMPDDIYNKSQIKIATIGLKPLLNQFERKLISKVFKDCEESKTLTAKLLKISRPTLHAKLKQYQIE
jgi:DNA-binding NtrC family response regulator